MENKFIFRASLLVMLKENRGRNLNKKSKTTVLSYFRRTPEILLEEETGGGDFFNCVHVILHIAAHFSFISEL